MEGKQKSLQNILFVYLIKNVKLRQNKIIFLKQIFHIFSRIGQPMVLINTTE